MNFLLLGMDPLTLSIRSSGHITQTNGSAAEPFKVSLWRTCIDGNCTFITFDENAYKSDSEGPHDGAIAGMILSGVFSLVALLTVCCHKKSAVIGLSLVAAIFGVTALGCWATFMHFGPKSMYAETALSPAVGLEVAGAALACKWVYTRVAVVHLMLLSQHPRTALLVLHTHRGQVLLLPRLMHVADE